MLKNRLMPVLALLLALVAPSVHAYVGPATLSPINPVAGQVITVNIPWGICDAVSSDGDVTGFPQITITGNAIRVLASSFHAFDSGQCLYPMNVAFETIGPLAAGNYTVQVDREYNNAGITIETIGVLALTVQSAPVPVAAPTLGFFSKAIIFLLAAALGCFALRRRQHIVLAITLAAIVGSSADIVHAQTPKAQSPPTIEVLLSTSPGAPTADDVVNYFARSPRAATPPLQSLTVQSPVASAYLMPLRATGDFLAHLQAYPNSPRAILERYVVIVYPAAANLQTALTSLQAEPTVQAAYITGSGQFSSAELQSFSVGGDQPFTVGTQYGRTDLNIDAAWQLAGGYALVGDTNSGLYQLHPALIQFSATGQYVGGNFIPIDSADIGQATSFIPLNFYESNVDELNPVQVPHGSSCDTNGTGFSVPAEAGHGTHVAGLIAANGDAGLGVEGTCKHCGIAMWKVANYQCFSPNRRPDVGFNEAAAEAAVGYLSGIGAQVINQSLGDSSRSGTFCTTNPTEPWCVSLTEAVGRDIVVVASSGNNRTVLQFPADDSRVISVGGFQETLALWDDSPGNNTNCPVLPGYAAGSECGSNYTKIAGGPMQELMASAHNVISTTYPQINWNPYVFCGDGFPMQWGNGVGNCNGTSMTAPQLSGVVGILRSINPLVHGGANPTTTGTIRNVLATQTYEAQAGQGWTPTFGYGHPDAAAAARKMLGKVAGATVRNRVTPLFRLYSTGAGDYADTTSPQMAVALMINSAHAWQPSGDLIPTYTNFPHLASDGNLAAPRASVYVLTTEVRPRNEWPALVPLYLMDKQFTSTHDDFMLTTTVADMQYAHSDGYNLRTIQGYIYQTCTPEPSCIPPGAEKLYRECKASVHDCATFLNHERSTFEANGYTSAYPLGTNIVLGYAYPSTDSDHDGLVDGFEYVIGTNPFSKWSNGDTSQTDAQRFPMVGLEISDPCLGGPLGAANCGADVVFKDGFDGL